MLTDNGGEKFSFCYVTDTVSALIDILLNGKSGEAYNISNDNANAPEQAEDHFLVRNRE